MPKFEKPKMSELISRAFTDYGVEKKDDGRAHIKGTPIVFDRPTDIGGYFEETIARGAISPEVLKDVAFFYNHDLNTKPLARTRTGKLNFDIRDDGVYMDADVNLNRSDVNDLYVAIDDGDIDGMSFMFRIEDEEWKDLDSEYPKRIIKKIGYVQEVSAVNYPAYPQTEIYARTDLSVDTDKQALDNARAKVLDNTNKVDNSTNKIELEKLKNNNRMKLGGI